MDQIGFRERIYPSALLGAKHGSDHLEFWFKRKSFFPQSPPALNHGYGASLASQRGGRSVENPPRVGDHTSGMQA